MIQINNLEDLTEAIRDPRLSGEQLRTIITETCGIWLDSMPEREKLAAELKEFLTEYPEQHSRPLFFER